METNELSDGIKDYTAKMEPENVISITELIKKLSSKRRESFLTK